MTTTDDLRKLALAATPGPWYDAGCWTVHGGDHNEVAHPTNFGDIAYIVACSPERILAMLDVIDAAKHALPNATWSKHPVDVAFRTALAQLERGNG